MKEIIDNENQRITKDTYECNVEKYFENEVAEVSGEFKAYLDSLLAYVKPTDKLLEVGSGTGRDGRYIESHSVSVTYTDFVESFLDLLRPKHADVRKLDILNDSLNETFDAVMANAVFLHFTSPQFTQALRNVIAHLNPGGYLALRLKSGEGEEYSSQKMGAPRYFKYWNMSDLRRVLEQHGFSILNLSETSDQKWIHCIAKLN